MIDISSDVTACDDLVLLFYQYRFLHESYRAAEQTLWAFEVLQETLLCKSSITIRVSRNRIDFAIVVMRGQGVFPTCPDWDRDYRRIKKRIVLLTGELASASLVTPTSDLKLVFSSRF